MEPAPGMSLMAPSESSNSHQEHSEGNLKVCLHESGYMRQNIINKMLMYIRN